jgi:hypothetical protein
VFAPIFKALVFVVLFAMNRTHEWTFIKALVAHEVILHSVDGTHHRSFGTNAAIVIGNDPMPFASEPCVRGPRNPHTAMLFGLEGFDVTTRVPMGKAAPNRASVVAPVIPKEHASVAFVGLVFGWAIHRYTSIGNPIPYFAKASKFSFHGLCDRFCHTLNASRMCALA